MYGELSNTNQLTIKGTKGSIKPNPGICPRKSKLKIIKPLTFTPDLSHQEQISGIRKLNC